MTYQELLVAEIKKVPEEHLPTILEIIRSFQRIERAASEGNEQAWEKLRGSITFYESPFEPAVDVNEWEVYR